MFGRGLHMLGVGGDLVAEHRHRLAHLATVGQRSDGAQLLGALAQILVHPRHRDPAGLRERERLAGVDRGDLLAIADHQEAIDAERIGDADQVLHLVGTHHRGFVEDQRRAGERVARAVIARSLPSERVAGIAVDERGDGAALDPGFRAEAIGGRLHEREADHLAALLLDVARDARQHGRLAGARDALDRDDTIGGGQRHRRGRHLACVEFLVARCGVDPLDDGVGGDDHPPLPLAALDLCKDAALRRERLGRRDMGDDAVDPVILARNQLLVADELGDARVDMRGGDTLQPEVERGPGDVRHRERGFALGMDADRGGDGVLGAQIHRRDAQSVETAGDERIGGSEPLAQAFADIGQDVTEALHRSWLGIEAASAGTLARGIDQCLAVESERGRPVTPFLAQGIAILDVQLGVAGIVGHLAQRLGGGDTEFAGFRQDIGAPLAEGVDHLLGHAGDLELAVLAGDAGLVADLRQLGAKLRVVGRADGRVVLPQLLVVERLPCPVRHLGHVGDQDMDVALWIERATRVVLEQRIDEVAGSHRIP